MKKWLSILVAMLLIAGALGGCSSGGEPDTAPGGDGSAEAGDGGGSGDSGGEKSLVMCTHGEYSMLDPHKLTSALDASMALNTHDPLLRMKTDGTLVPNLASEWEISEDGRTYTFTLREDVTFQDGSPMKASDVKFSLERAKASPTCQRQTSWIKSIEAPGDYTVVITAENPSFSGLKYLSTAFTSIVSEKIVTEVGDENYINNLCGTGPYQIIENKTGDRCVLEAYDDYFQGKPAVKHVTTRSIPESTTAMIALETGDVDVLISVNQMDVPTIQENPDLGYQDTSSPTLWSICMNTEKTPFGDVRVRQAIAMTIDPQECIDVALEGAGIVAETPLHPMTTGYVEGVGRWPNDIEKAKELLAEAGYPDGFSTKITTQDNYLQKVCQVIQANLAKIGIKLELVAVPYTTWVTDCSAGNFEMCIIGNADVILDSELSLGQHRTPNIGSTNFSRFVNPKVEELFAELTVTMDPAQRLDISRQILELEKEEVPRIPLFFPMARIAYHNYVKNVTVSPVNAYFFYDWDRE